jgi:hypothetical protein
MLYVCLPVQISNKVPGFNEILYALCVTGSQCPTIETYVARISSSKANGDRTAVKLESVFTNKLQFRVLFFFLFHGLGRL